MKHPWDLEISRQVMLLARLNALPARERAYARYLHKTTPRSWEDVLGHVEYHPVPRSFEAVLLAEAVALRPASLPPVKPTRGKRQSRRERKAQKR